MDILQDSCELNEMYQLYGMASHHCSNIEYQIIYLLLGPEWSKIEDLDPDKITKVKDELSSKPLGALFKIYQQHFQFSSEIIEEMKMILDKRNYLIHRFFGGYGKKMHDKAVVNEMIEELKMLISTFQSASYSLDPSRWK